jgi:hypothetical protein
MRLRAHVGRNRRLNEFQTSKDLTAVCEPAAGNLHGGAGARNQTKRGGRVGRRLTL